MTLSRSLTPTLFSDLCFFFFFAQHTLFTNALNLLLTISLSCVIGFFFPTDVYDHCNNCLSVYASCIITTCFVRKKKRYTFVKELYDV